MNNYQMTLSDLKSKDYCKPFLKWAGGKNQLIPEIEKYYPFKDKKITKYAEPFVGGGAILFDILNKFDLSEIYIGDINTSLINTYINIRDNLDKLITLLESYENEYLPLNKEDRKEYYLTKRAKFNSDCDKIEKSALMIFLNKTCFNGLYRVNKKGLFNVPMGDYKKPLICDYNNLICVSKKLNNIKIVNADYKKSIDFIDHNTFVYIDPPYRPLTETSSFTSYTEYEFNDNSQIELSRYFDLIHNKGAYILLSNSDPKNVDINDNFFDELYKNYNIKRVNAKRMINSNSNKRGTINELLISNY